MAGLAPVVLLLGVILIILGAVIFVVSKRGGDRSDGGKRAADETEVVRTPTPSPLAYNSSLFALVYSWAPRMHGRGDLRPFF